MSKERVGPIMLALGAGVLIMLFGWQASSLVPSGGLDGSWQAGIWMATHNGVSFGDHAIFTIRTMLCNYRQAAVAGIFAVLERTDNRCSSARALSTAHGDWGQAVPVPGPPNGHSSVLVRIHGVQVSGLERVRAALFKPSKRGITINGLRFRLVQATAADGLPLRASSVMTPALRST